MDRGCWPRTPLLKKLKSPLRPAYGAYSGMPRQKVVEILPTDVAFKSSHCQPWEKIG